MVKLKIIKTFFAFLFLSLILTSCPELEGEYLSIVNNSDEGIIWGIGGMEYEDNPWITNSAGKVISSMEDNKNSIWYIKPGETYLDFVPSHIFDGKFHEKIPRHYCILKYDSVLMIPWDRVRDERISLKEVVFTSWEDLEKCNFTITYP